MSDILSPPNNLEFGVLVARLERYLGPVDDSFTTKSLT